MAGGVDAVRRKQRYRNLVHQIESCLRKPEARLGAGSKGRMTRLRPPKARRCSTPRGCLAQPARRTELRERRSQQPWPPATSLVENRFMDFSFGSVDNLIVDRYIAEHFKTSVQTASLPKLANITDRTEMKPYQGATRGAQSHCRRYPRGREGPICGFINTVWSRVNRPARARLKQTDVFELPFVLGSDPTLDAPLADIVHLAPLYLAPFPELPPCPVRPPA